MASRQNIREEEKAAKEERAEVAARVAASELSDVNRERREGYEAQQEQSPGVIGSLLKTVQGTLGHAKEAVIGKTHETVEVSKEGANAASEKAKETKDMAAQKAGEMTEKTKETKDYTAEKAKEANDKTMGKAGEYKDYAAEKAKEAKDTTVGTAGEYKEYAAEKAKETTDEARETKDAAMQKAGEYKDYAAEKAKEGKDMTMEKAGEYKDYTAEKAKEGKETTVGKMTELKDSAADAAKRAMGFLTGKKEETKQKAEESAQVGKDKLGETEEATRRKMEDFKIKEDEAKQRVEADDRESGTDSRGSGGLLGALGSVKESIKEKLSIPTTDSGHESPAREQHARSGSGEGKIVAAVEEISPAGATAEALKEADQMSGQTFNDVGRLADEGVVVVERKDRQGKM